jgi:hypothetical protein
VCLRKETSSVNFASHNGEPAAPGPYYGRGAPVLGCAFDSQAKIDSRWLQYLCGVNTPYQRTSQLLTVSPSIGKKESEHDGCSFFVCKTIGEHRLDPCARLHHSYDAENESGGGCAVWKAMWWRTASLSTSHSSARARVWLEHLSSQTRTRSRPTLSCSQCRRQPVHGTA